MKVIKVGDLLSEMLPVMHNLEIITGGYVTEISSLLCERLERFATSTGMDKIEYYGNEKGEIFSFHYAHTLSLQESICAVDYFPDYNQAEVNKVSDILMQAIKKHRILRTTI